MNNGKIIALSAPSGAGKSTICNHILKKYSNVQLSISATTRIPRKGEKDTVHYYFLSEEKFKSKIAKNEFLEYEKIHGNYYGTLIKTVEDILNNGEYLLLDIDVLGAIRIKEIYPRSTLIYIKAPSIVKLKERLVERKTENTKQINKRLERVYFEEGKAKKFDHIVINNNLNETIQQIEHIIFNGD